MRKFLKHLTIFLALVIVIAIAFDVAVSYGLRKSPKGHLDTFNTIMGDGLDYDLILMGNSRTSFHISPRILDSIMGCNSFNMGISGQAFDISELRYRIYTRKNPAPKYILLNIDAAELANGNPGYEMEQYFPYILDTILQGTKALDQMSWPMLHLPMWRYIGKYKYIGFGLGELFGIYSYPTLQYKGFTARDDKWNGTTLNNLLTHNSTLKVGKIEESTAKLFEKFIEERQAEGIKIAMVYTPIYYLVETNYEDYYDTIMDYYYAISEKYNVPILDYRTLPMCYDTTYFYEGSHINRLGTEIFSTQLAHDLDSIGFIENN